MGAIFAMNTQSLQILRSTRLLANGSQILQERMEALRDHPWPEVANAPALAMLLQTPAPSERELGDAHPIETVTVSIPDVPARRRRITAPSIAPAPRWQGGRRPIGQPHRPSRSCWSR
ncbi:MAG: hypothetical protein WDN28_20495 [Chthoniobacter sp.]